HARRHPLLGGPVPPVPQAVLPVVRGGVVPLRASPRRDRGVPAHHPLVVALLAPSRDRLDRARTAVGGARLLAPTGVPPAVPRGTPLPTGLVVRRDLPARPLPLCGAARSAVPERGHGVDGMDLLRLLAAGACPGRRSAGRRALPVGTA